MNEPLRVAWLGHQSGRAGDGLLTYSRETVAGLRARGVKIFFVHHGTLAAITDDGLTLRSLTGSHRYIISSPRTKRSITDLLRRENVDLVHVSLSFSTLLAEFLDTDRFRTPRTVPRARPARRRHLPRAL